MIDEFPSAEIGVESGQISLERVLPVYANADLWDVPELERSAEASNLVRSNYAGNAVQVVETVKR